MIKRPTPIDFDIVPPGAASLLQSLRSVGYGLSAAIADIIDNSIAAGASEVHLKFHWSGDASTVAILDNGRGMGEMELTNAMRPGSRNPLEERDEDDLGRFGLGLKTASFSQCRELSVASKCSGAKAVVRTWDLDYVTEHNEWRLLKKASTDCTKLLPWLEGVESGTAVVWSKIDGIVSAGIGPNDAVSQARFHRAIADLQQHLALTFHRFIEDRGLKILLNGTPIEPWNPFLPSEPAVTRSPIEKIVYRSDLVRFQGFVLPHKDKLTPDQFEEYGGPNGWNSQQGFYVYRNRRLLLCGDWLGFGIPYRWTLREEFRLARICLEIGNTTDSDWQLDMKKSTARPPEALRDRLTDLAEMIRTQARSVFAHRGRYGTRAAPSTEMIRPWVTVSNGKLSRYVVNREHPLVKAVIHAVGEKAPEIERLLRILEQTVPIQQIWLDAAEEKLPTSSAYEHIPLDVIRSDLRCAFSQLKQSDLAPSEALAVLRTVEPFTYYPSLIKELEP